METNKQENQPLDTAIPAPTQQDTTETPSVNEDIGSFGTSRGSGLSRGKRSIAQPQPNLGSSNASASPDAVQILTYKSEFKNPFQAETESESATQAENKPEAESSEETKEEGASVTHVDENIEAEENSLLNEQAMPKNSEVAEVSPLEGKATLNILPPASPDHNAAQEWNPDSNRGRPIFKPEGRQRYRDENQKQGREKDTKHQRDEKSSYNSQKEKRTEKPQGFFGWLKSLFTSKSISRKSKHHNRRHHNGRRNSGNPLPRPENTSSHNQRRNHRNHRSNSQFRMGSGHRNRGYRGRHSSSNHEGRPGSGNPNKE